jgi:competence protein ComEA
VEFAGITDLKEWVKRWVAYVGPRRLATGMVVSIAAAVTAWLLVRPSGATIESMLPMTTVQVPRDVVVHVAGAVRRPGVYRLPTTARVVDAVTMAGGATARADLESINLAQTIIDTEQIFVPSRRAPRSVTRVAPRLRPHRNSTSPGQGVTQSTLDPPLPTTTSSQAASRVNLNTATASQLDTLPGVGPTTARAIISYRTKNGPFRKVEDLLNVTGIGPSKLAAMRDRVTV